MKNYGLKLTSTNAVVHDWHVTSEVQRCKSLAHAATLIFIFCSLVTRRVRVCAWVRRCVCLHVCLYCMLERVRARARPLMRMRMIAGSKAGVSDSWNHFLSQKELTSPNPPHPYPLPQKEKKARKKEWVRIDARTFDNYDSLGAPYNGRFIILHWPAIERACALWRTFNVILRPRNR